MQLSVGDFNLLNYWSSSQRDATISRLQLFGNGTQINTNKSNSFYVRPVRRF